MREPDQVIALRSAIWSLYRERQALVAVIDALFAKLAEAKRDGQLQYDRGYKRGLRNGSKKG